MQVDAQVLINIILTTIVTSIVGCVGWFGRLIWTELKEVIGAVHQLEVDLPHTYVKREDYREDMQEVKALLHRIADKLDEKADKVAAIQLHPGNGNGPN